MASNLQAKEYVHSSRDPAMKKAPEKIIYESPDEVPAEWLTAAAVRNFLGVSERQVQRYHTDRRLMTYAYLRQSGTKPATLYRVEEVMLIKRDLDIKRESAAHNALLARAANRNGHAEGEAFKVKPKHLQELMGALTEWLHNFKAPPPPEGQQPEKPHQVELRDKVLLSMKEAQELGYTRAQLLDLVREGILRNFGNRNYRLSQSELRKYAAARGDLPKMRAELSEYEYDGGPVRRIS